MYSKESNILENIENHLTYKRLLSHEDDVTKRYC